MKTFITVFITILLSFAVFLSFGFQSKPHEHLVEMEEPRNETGFTDLEYLQRAFRVYNHAYFEDRLNVPTIDMEEEQMQATTHCENGGVDCRIKFNPVFVKAPRNANLVILHEMCHIKTWDEDMDKLMRCRLFSGCLGPDDFTKHGKHWRACMVDLDDQGAFRNILIDFYQGRGQ